MFWVVAMICTANTCSLPEEAYSPAYSIYATREACERRLSIAEKPFGIEWSCQQTDTATFGAGGFSGNASIMIHKLPDEK